jgi:hypothetical protein
MAKLDKIEKGAKNAHAAETQQNAKNGIDFNHPVFANATEACKSFIRKNSEHFTMIGGVPHFNPAIVKIAGYTPETGETDPGFQRDRSHNLAVRTWNENKSDGTTVEVDNKSTKDRIVIDSMKSEFKNSGYRHGSIELQYVGGDKVVPALWVVGGRHRSVAMLEYNENAETQIWAPFTIVTGKVAAKVNDFLSNTARVDLTPLARAQVLAEIFESQENGVKYTIEYMSERFGLPAETIRREIQIIRDIIPTLQEVSSDGKKNVNGEVLSFTTHLSMIASAIPASAQQRDFLEKWMAGKIPSVKDHCLAIKRARKAAEGPANANESGENPTGESKRRGRAESALYPKNGGLNATDLRYFAMGGIPNDLILNADGIKQLLLSVIGWDEFPDELQAAVDSFDFEAARKTKTSPKSGKARVESSTSSVKKVELPAQYQNLSSLEDLRRAAEEHAAKNNKKEEEAPSTGVNLDFLSGFGEDSPQGDSFQ